MKAVCIVLLERTSGNIFSGMCLIHRILERQTIFYLSLLNSGFMTSIGLYQTEFVCAV